MGFFISTKDPRKVIKIFGCQEYGCPMHFPNNRKRKMVNVEIRRLKKRGGIVLIIWEHELYDEEALLQKVHNFEDIVTCQN